MASVMMNLIQRIAILMEVTVVDHVLLKIIVLYVNAKQDSVRNKMCWLEMAFVMTKPTMLFVDLMVLIAVKTRSMVTFAQNVIVMVSAFDIVHEVCITKLASKQ
jgi:hypothetical protein